MINCVFIHQAQSLSSSYDMPNFAYRHKRKGNSMKLYQFLFKRRQQQCVRVCVCVSLHHKNVVYHSVAIVVLIKKRLK